MMVILPPNQQPRGSGITLNTTYDVPAEESPVAFPIGTDQYVEEFLKGRTKSIESLLTAMTQTANIASPSLPIRQAMNCLLRACITQKCGRLLRALPPDKTTNFSIQVDEKLIRATQDIFKLEEMGELQKDLVQLSHQNQGDRLHCGRRVHPHTPSHSRHFPGHQLQQYNCRRSPESY